MRYSTRTVSIAIEMEDLESTLSLILDCVFGLKVSKFRPLRFEFRQNPSICLYIFGALDLQMSALTARKP